MASNYNPAMAHVGLYLPKKLVAEIDRAKGYYTRNKFLQMITEEYLTAQKNREPTQLIALGDAEDKIWV